MPRWRCSSSTSRSRQECGAMDAGRNCRPRCWSRTTSCNCRSPPSFPPICASSRARSLLDQSMLTGESVPVDSRRRQARLCRRAGAPRRGRRGGHRHRFGDLFRARRRTRAHCPCGKRRGQGGARPGAQPVDRQCGDRDRARRLCPCDRIARTADYPARAHRDALRRAGRAAGDLHARRRARRQTPRAQRRAADAPFGACTRRRRSMCCAPTKPARSPKTRSASRRFDRCAKAGTRTMCSPLRRSPVRRTDATRSMSPIRRAAQTAAPQRPLPAVRKFTPFDPASKRAEATAQDAEGHEISIVKGAPAAVAAAGAVECSGGG